MKKTSALVISLWLLFLLPAGASAASLIDRAVDWTDAQLATAPRPAPTLGAGPG